METKRLKALFFVRRVGPYHDARFREAAKLVDLTVIETRSASQEYTWQFQSHGGYQLDQLPRSIDVEAGLHGRELLNAISAVFKKHKADVVVTTGWADQEYHAVVLEAARLSIPRVVISDSRYEDEPRKLYKELIKKRILKSYSSAIVAGTASKNYLLRLAFQEKAIFHPWDVVDNDHFHVDDRNVDFAKRYFLCVSRFVAKKNLETLISSFASYVQQGGQRRLVLLGSGELEAKLRSCIRQYKIDDHVDLPGFAQYDSLKEYYRSAFCLILPSMTDQWGLVVNEAMAAGLPVVVSSNCGSALDLVKETKNGLTFDPMNGIQLTQQLLTIDKTSERQWRAMGEMSLAIIDSWGLSQFAGALHNAARYALSNTRGISLFLHRILAR
jgi:glycosyltransferase involved in cell wall biosynthesis